MVDQMAAHVAGTSMIRSVLDEANITGEQRIDRHLVALQNIVRLLERIEQNSPQSIEEPDQFEQIVIGTLEQTLYTKERRYIALYVTAPQSITIRSILGSSTVILQPGWNPIDNLESLVVSAASDTQVLLVRSNQKYDTSYTQAGSTTTNNTTYYTGHLGVTTTPQQVEGLWTQRASVTIYNNGATTVYLGESNTVSATTGFPLAAGAGIEVDGNNAIYAVTASGTSDLRWITEFYA